MKLPTYPDLEAAVERTAPHIVQTPLLESPLLNQLVGGRVLVKAEPLQKTGSFKFRGQSMPYGICLMMSPMSLPIHLAIMPLPSLLLLHPAACWPPLSCQKTHQP